MVILAESVVGFDTVAGGSVTAMLVAVMIAFLKRTKETDDRRDAGMQILIDAANAREARAWKEYERVLGERDEADDEVEKLRTQVGQLNRERDTARQEIDQLRIQLDVERERNQ